jgi:hypothetical protein
VLRWETAWLAGTQSDVLASARDQLRLHAMRPPARASLLLGPIAENVRHGENPCPSLADERLLPGLIEVLLP